MQVVEDFEWSEGLVPEVVLLSVMGVEMVAVVVELFATVVVLEAVVVEWVVQLVAVVAELFAGQVAAVVKQVVE